MKTPDLACLEEALGHAFQRRTLLRLALVHPSFRHERGRKSDNQRLEFLGDAALGLAAAQYLYRRHGRMPEGELTRLRSAVTAEPHLGRVGLRLGLGAYLRLGRGERLSGGATRPSVLADAVEALVGAAFLDGGLPAVERIFVRHFRPTIRKPPSEHHLNPKGTLQERVQRAGHATPAYRLVTERGPAHERVYDVEVSVAGEVAGRGSGRSKQAAEKVAAADALARLGSRARE